MALEIQHTVASTFAAHQGSPFRLRGDTEVVELELVEVADRSTPRHVTFSLIFRGPHQPAFPQRIYRFEHDRLGAFDLFIVPIGRDAGGVRYEAIVNRVTEPGASAAGPHAPPAGGSPPTPGRPPARA